MIFMQNVLLIKESNEISLMTLTVLPALQHTCLICCSSAAFLGGMFSIGWYFFINRNLLRSFTEIHGLVILHKRTTNCSKHSKSSSLIQETTGNLKNMYITVFTVKVKSNSVWRPAYILGSCMLAEPGSDLWRKRKNKEHTYALI